MNVQDLSHENSLMSELAALPSQSQRAILADLSFRLGTPTVEDHTLRTQALEAAVKVAQQTKENAAVLAYDIFQFLCGHVPTEN